MAIHANPTQVQPDHERSRRVDAGADAAAFGRFFDAHLPRIYAFFARRIEERGIAEELTISTFERAIEAFRADDARGGIGVFMTRVAADAVVDNARRRRKVIPRDIRASDTDGPGDREAAEALANEAATRIFAAFIERSRLRQAFTRLSDEDRNVVLLRYFDGLEIDEMCAATGASRQELAMRLHRALRALRSTLDRQATDAA